ncbi:MAG: lipid-A-disaccharide synthase [Helicobacter sp.]|nr:lipid-A-disaccharide synthase [Helicobacter sp.]
MTTKPLKIFVSALEYSSNIHLNTLIQNLQKNKIHFELEGIFDSTQIPNKSLFSVEEFRVMGFVDILKLLPKYFNIQQTLLKKIQNCDIAIFMDSSSFNLPIIKRLAKYPKKPYIIYYILPQVWAWKAYRAKIIAKTCDGLWGILPFERIYYPKQTNISYVGHPLLDILPFEYQTRRITNVVAFMPGSRKSEIMKLMPVFKRLAQLLKVRNKQALLIIPKHLKKTNLQTIYGDTSDFIQCFDVYEGLKTCEISFVCSGTATLETTLLGIPTILVYKAKPLDFFLAKLLVKLHYIGLPNIILEFHYFQSPKNNPTPKDFPIIPEILQNKVTPKTLLNALDTFDYQKFFTQKQILRNYLKNGSVQTCVEKIKNFAKNLSK